MTSGKFGDVLKLLEDFDFNGDKNIPDEFKCLKCNKILINACIGSCECQLCRICVDKLLESGGKICPGNNDECKESNLSDFQIDHRVNRKIPQLVVRCPQEMCLFESELINMNEHLRVCPHKNVKYAFYGSNVAVNDNLQSTSYSHMDIMMGAIDNMRNEIGQLREREERNRDEIGQLREREERNRDEIGQLKEREEINNNAMNKWKEPDEAYKKAIEKWEETNDVNKKAIDIWKETNDMNKKVIEIWKETDGINKNAIAILKENDEANKKAIAIWKETNDINKEAIEKWKETNEVNNNVVAKWKEIDELNKIVIDQLKESDERNRNEIEMLKCDSEMKDERIKSLEEEIRVVTEGRMNNLQREIGKAGAEGDEGRDALDADEQQPNGTDHNDIGARISAIEDRIHQQISGTFFCAIDNVDKRRGNGEQFEIGYFYAQRCPYKWALVTKANGHGPVEGAGISFVLAVYADPSLAGTQCPFEADVAIGIRNKASPGACKSVSKHLTYQKLANRMVEGLDAGDGVNRCPGDATGSEPICRLLDEHDYFDFLYCDLASASLLIGDCFIVECRVDLR